MADLQGVTVEGLKNQGHVCYFNSTLQVSIHILASFIPSCLDIISILLFTGIGVVQCIDACS